MSSRYDSIPKKDKGAWVVQHSQKTASTQNASAEFPAIDAAGKASSLLSRFAASEQLLIPSKKLTCSDRATNSSCWRCHKRGSGGERLEFDGVSEVCQAFDQACFCRSVERRLK